MNLIYDNDFEKKDEILMLTNIQLVIDKSSRTTNTLSKSPLKIVFTEIIRKLNTGLNRYDK